MRRGTMILAVALIALAGIGIGAGAYNAGERNGLEQQLETIETTTAEGNDVVQVVGPADLGNRGYREHGGFLPFGFLLFPLFIIGTFVLVGALMRGGPGRWRGPGGPGMWGPGSGGPDEGWRSRADAWHREMHERAGRSEGSPEPPQPPGAAASPA